MLANNHCNISYSDGRRTKRVDNSYSRGKFKKAEASKNNNIWMSFSRSKNYKYDHSLS